VLQNTPSKSPRLPHIAPRIDHRNTTFLHGISQNPLKKRATLPSPIFL
jgi:hypothetical protein